MKFKTIYKSINKIIINVFVELPTQYQSLWQRESCDERSNKMFCELATENAKRNQCHRVIDNEMRGANGGSRVECGPCVAEGR